MKAFIVLLALLFPSASFAAMHVEVKSEAKDTVGNRLIYAVKEKIRASSSLELTFDEKSPRLQARFVTLDANENGRSTVYSMVLTWDKGDDSLALYLETITGICGSSIVAECADGLVADISETSDQIIRALSNSGKR